MSKVVSEQTGEFYQHYPKIAVIITVRTGEKINAMAAAWHCSMSFTPPIYGISISPKRATYRMIADSGYFGVNFLPYEKGELAAAVGATSGREVDKFSRFNIATEPPIKTPVPILKDAYLAYECQLIDDREYGDHHWLAGKVVAMHYDNEVFSDDVLNVIKIHPLMYLGRDRYSTTTRRTKYLDREQYKH